jgi:hypothetical protein
MGAVRGGPRTLRGEVRALVNNRAPLTKALSMNESIVQRLMNKLSSGGLE